MRPCRVSEGGFGRHHHCFELVSVLGLQRWENPVKAAATSHRIEVSALAEELFRELALVLLEHVLSNVKRYQSLLV